MDRVESLPAGFRRPELSTIDRVAQLIDASISEIGDEIDKASRRAPDETDIATAVASRVLSTWTLWLLDPYVEAGALHGEEVRLFILQKFGVDVGMPDPESY